MAKKTRFLMIGGFLGAGKTTAIGRVAKRLSDDGLRVGVVTNDQAQNLVDSHALRSQGLDVGEVPGACFCCKFDELVDTAARLGANEQPDVILTEPVGSCTDLVATVIEPLRRLHGDRYEVGPLVVLCKPEHGARILATPPGGGDAARRPAGFSPKAEYIFLKQLEEADVIVVNKIDKLPAAEARRIAELVRRRSPDKRVLLASGKTGAGFDDLLAAMERPRPEPSGFMPIDYDLYAEGEAELAWLNATVEVTSGDDAPFELDRIVQACVRRIADNLAQADYEPAHLKVLGHAGEQTSIANLVAAGSPAELSLASSTQSTAATLIVNARVSGEPEVLAAVVDEALSAQGVGAPVEFRTTSCQHFRPGRPEPTHRLR